MIKSLVLKNAKKLTRIASTFVFIKSCLNNQMMLRQVEVALNKVFNHQSQIQEHLLALDGKSLNIQMAGLGLKWNVSFINKQLIINNTLDNNADCDIILLSKQLPTALIKGNQNNLIKVEGDFITALHFQSAFQRLDFSLYPILIETIGQIPATFIMNTAQHISETIVVTHEKLKAYARTSMKQR